MAFYVDNAVSWAVLNTRGGWRNAILIPLSYAFIFCFLITVFYQVAEQPRDKHEVLNTFSIIVVMVQVVIAVLLGGISVAGVIRRDVASRQMESNRLMPMSPVQAIAGYIFGAVATVLAMGIVNLGIGCALSLMLGLPPVDWIAANGLLLMFCVCVWSAMAVAGFFSRVMFGILLAICGSIAVSGGFIFIVVPGLLALCTPMQGETIFQTSSMGRLDPGVIVGAAAQLLLAVIFIRGAARKYQCSDAGSQVFPLAPAMALLGIWSGLTWFGISYFMDMRPEHMRYASIDWHAVVIGGLTSCLLVALLPVASIAWTNIHRQQYRLAGEEVSSRWWLFWTWLPVCVLFAVIPLSARINPASFRAEWRFASPSPVVVHYSHVYDHPAILFGKRHDPLMIACACGICLIEFYFLMRLFYPRMRLANLLLLFLLILLWFGPLLGDVIYYNLQNANEPHMDHFALLSPVGTMIQGLDNPGPMAWFGVMGQAMIAGIPAVIFLLMGTKAKRLEDQTPIAAEAAPQAF